jgi:hypothetical protein
MRGQPYAGRSVAALAAAIAASTLACSPSSTVGVLGRGQFRYSCGSAVDAYCGTTQTAEMDLPGAIAVGAAFAVVYAPQSGNSTSTVEGNTGYEIVPASAEFATASGTNILAGRAGLVALLAQHVGNADVDDFVHVKFSAIQSVQASPASLSLSGGEMQTVRLAATDAVGGQLAGQLPCQWQVTSGASSVALHPLSTGGAATLEGVSTGSASVRATCGAATVDVVVTVTGGLPNDGGTNG